MLEVSIFLNVYDSSYGAVTRSRSIQVNACSDLKPIIIPAAFEDVVFIAVVVCVVILLVM